MTLPVLVEFDNITIRYELVDGDDIYLHLEYDGKVTEQGFERLQHVFDMVLEEAKAVNLPFVSCILREDKQKRIDLVESLGFIEESQSKEFILYRARVV